ncbi:MAG: type III-B CRISPR module RAMP protein Cmr6 [Pseudonocardiales bacterium]
MTAYGVLRHVLGDDEIDQLTGTIEAQLSSRQRDPATSAGFDDLGTINPALLLHRLWLDGDRKATNRAEVRTALKDAQLRAVAAACAKVPRGLLDAVHARRAAAATALAASHPGWTWRSMRIAPMWRLVVGHGEDSVHETALTLSPTYGVPVLPGTALKGLAAATARAAVRERAAAKDRDSDQPDRDLGDVDIGTLFGTPRPGRKAEAHRGSVLVWDALPTHPPKLVLDVLTPHVKDYYDSGNSAGATPNTAPAEYYNPVPIRFLAVEKTLFRAYLIGPPKDVQSVVKLIHSGLDEWGIGGRTAAGYGYCVSREEVG